MRVEFGDMVHYSLDGFEGVLVCIGSPYYSPDGSVVVLADDKVHGMPINVVWCTVVGKYELDKTIALREKYIHNYGTNFLSERVDGR